MILLPKKKTQKKEIQAVLLLLLLLHCTLQNRPSVPFPSLPGLPGAQVIYFILKIHQILR